MGYETLLRHVLLNGQASDDRTGVGTYSIFGYQMRFDLSRAFPIVTTKKVHFKSVVHELLWFPRGDTNIAYPRENGVRIWDEWADERGEVGRVYGAQWRNWGGQVDQLSNLIAEIKRNPNSRRLILSAWNVAELPEMALAPCHCLCQFYVRDGKLSCQLYQRSADVFLGVPFNIASYSLLTAMIAQVCGLEVGEFVHTFGDVHLYKNHVQQAHLQLSRSPYPMPKLWLNPGVTDLFAFKYEDIRLEGYQAHPAIKAEVAV